MWVFHWLLLYLSSQKTWISLWVKITWNRCECFTFLVESSMVLRWTCDPNSLTPVWTPYGSRSNDCWLYHLWVVNGATQSWRHVYFLWWDTKRWIQWFNLMYQYEDLDCSCWPDLLMKAGFLEAIDRGHMVFLSGLTECWSCILFLFKETSILAQLHFLPRRVTQTEEDSAKSGVSCGSTASKCRNIYHAIISPAVDKMTQLMLSTSCGELF